MEHEQAGAQVSDALRAAKHWRLYREAQRRAESSDARLEAVAAIHVAFDDEGSIRCEDDGYTWPCPTIRAVRD